MKRNVFAAAEITKNNRITVPKKVLEALDLEVGDLIFFVRKGSQITIKGGE